MRWLAGAAFFLMAACAAAEPPRHGDDYHPPHEHGEVVVPQPVMLECAGAMTQGGVALCRTNPGAELRIGGEGVGHADANGWAVIGFNREAPESMRVEAHLNGISTYDDLAIAPREFDVQRIDGLPQQTVTPTDPAVLERISREAALKREAFTSQAPMTGFLDGFIMPVDGGVVTGRWGNQRILNGVPSTPHFGYDIAVPAGTPIRAPAAGVVTLANPDMHYEGGLVFIDHGQGLITMYLHMSRLDVRVGDVVSQGQVIGAVGASGRATGPHLCWRMRWRERQLDPSIAVEGLATARAELIQH
ncbi:MAG TPA: M23 family metallopeptidase [Vitreimonas sp.]|uniref:M23 family metallopeptidase n=1 Tax=Vitreimonas sp. TaxID=3069702 RepID=UPI002D375D99|nr:M23 family metallopeptidase [Vitreimonas sp.]HYD87234.1 M23 family metallopeptidase [Vitreimonas sp.]